MGLQYKKEILPELKQAGYSTAKLRKDRLLSESTIQKLRHNQPVAWSNVESVCELLNCQPGDILEYVPE